MSENGRRSTSSPQPNSGAGAENGATASEEEFEAATMRLRKRWELASVLNFLGTFEPLIEGDLKMTAEDIEMALIKPDASLAKIHVAILKGIPPVNKNLFKSGVWVTSLCKKLDDWWPWVAEGEIPLTVDKGEEVSKYKELDPTERLLMLKALCEVRTEQDDFGSYINDLLKQGSEPSSFRKDKVGEDGNNTSYWYDGNDVVGHRLYREVNKHEKSKYKSKAYIDPPTNNLQWETLATNLDEFHKVLDELSSSKVYAETAVCEIIETIVIPALEKLQKKKEKALKRQQRQDTLLNGFHAHARVSGTTRSCRVRKPVNYTFDDYDQAINEAIQMTKKGNVAKKRKRNGKRTNVVSDTDSDGDDQRDGSVDSMDKDRESDEMEEKENGNNSEKDVSAEMDDTDNDSEVDKSDPDTENDSSGNTKRLKLNSREQMEKDTNGSIGVFTRRLNSLRNQNHSNGKRSAMDSHSPTASDSDDGSSSKDPSQQNNSLVAADSEDETSS